MKPGSKSEAKRVCLELNKPEYKVKVQQGSSSSIFHSIPAKFCKKLVIETGTIMYATWRYGAYYLSDYSEPINEINVSYEKCSVYCTGPATGRKNRTKYLVIPEGMTPYKKGDTLTIEMSLQQVGKNIYYIIKIKKETAQ